MAGRWWVELGLGPQVGRAVSRGVSRGSCGLFRLQAACLLMGGAVSPPPPPPPPGLNDPRCRPAEAFVPLTAFCRLRLCPQGELQLPHPASPGDSPRPAGRCGPGSYQLTAFALVPVRVRFCGRPLRVKPLFPLSCGAPAIKPRWLWGLVFPVLEPRAGEPDMRLKARTPVGERLQCIYSPACGSAVCRGRGYGI